MTEKIDQDNEYKKLIEAALFVSGRSLSINEIAAALGIISVGYIKQISDVLVDEYKTRNSPFIINKINEKYELVLREPYATKVSTLAGSPDLTKSALRVLAYVSKNEPIMQNALVKTFGQSVYVYVKEIEDKGFINTKKIGRTKRIETTQRFREYFNIG